MGGGTGGGLSMEGPVGVGAALAAAFLGGDAKTLLYSSSPLASREPNCMVPAAGSS